jgi:cob(I)alamin adenosyltransferase
MGQSGYNRHMSSYFTRDGDEGYTGLLGDQRVPKYDIRPSTYGELDEASAALGFARALSTSDDTKQLLIQIQRDLYRIMAEVAATVEAADQFHSVDPERVTWLEEHIDAIGKRLEMPKGFIIPGDTASGAALDLARTIIRRAERKVAQLVHEGQLANTQVLVYLNRLSSLCFILVLLENIEAGIESPTLAKQIDS